MNPVPSRTLVLATATTYRWPKLAPFVLSLRATGFSGPIILLVENKWLQPEDHVQLRAARVDARPIYPFLSRVPHAWRTVRFRPALAPLRRALPRLPSWLPLPARTRLQLRDRAATWVHPIMSARLYFYRHLLADLGSYFDRVLLCDVRDVVFQTNPDDWTSPAALDVFLETPEFTLGSEPVNTRWIRLLAGEKELARLNGQRTSCAGVVSGKTAGVQAYLDAMTAELMHHTSVIGDENGFDQGVHNLLLRTGRLPDARIWENGEGLVLNMAAVATHLSRPGSDGLIRNSKGQPVPVLHQYDRFPEMRDYVQKRFGSAGESLTGAGRAEI